MKLFFPLVTAFLLLCSCSKPSGSNGPGSDPVSGFITGKLTGPGNEPLAGVVVTASHDTWYNTVAQASTDESGRYSIDLRSQPRGSWSLNAQVIKTYQGFQYSFQVDPENTSPLTHEGGVRNLQWKLTGTIPGTADDARIGGYVSFFENSGMLVPVKEIELTLVPEGPLVDGSTGQTIVRMADDFPTRIFGFWADQGIRDIPVGRYRVSARWIAPGSAPRQMELRDPDGGEFKTALAANFKQPNFSRFQEMALVIRVKP